MGHRVRILRPELEFHGFPLVLTLPNRLKIQYDRAIYANTLYFSCSVVSNQIFVRGGWQMGKTNGSTARVA